MSRGIYFLIVFFLLGIHIQAQDFVVDTNLETVFVEQLSVYNDSTKSRSLEEIVDLYGQHKFTNTKHYSDIVGIGNFDYWFVLHLKNKAKYTTDIVFEIPLARLNSFTLYSLEQSKLKLEGFCGGTNTGIYDKPLWSYNHAVKVTLRQNEQKTFFFKINKFPGSVRASVVAYSPKFFDKKQRNINSLLSFMLGIGCIVFATSFIIGFVQQNTAYFVFAALTFLRISHNLQFFNYADILNLLWFSRISSSMILLISLMFQYQFFKLFFKENNPRWLIGLVSTLFMLDISFGNLLQANKYYYFLSYFAVLALGLYYSYEILRKFKTTSKTNYFFLIIEIGILSMQTLFLLKYQINFNHGFFHKFGFDLLLWGSLVELMTYLIYLFRGIILLNNDFLKKSLALSEARNAIIHTQETERKIIAQDLHDDLGATLSALKGRNKREGFSNETQNLLNKAIADLRAISRRLLPVDFEMLGLIPSIEKYISDINQQQTLKVTFIVFGKIVKLNPEKELNIYRIITELVNNSTKYSNGKNATVQLVYHQNYLFVSIEDDGIVESKTDNNLGIGLKNINSRLYYLNANPIAIEIGGQRSYSFVFEVPYSPNL